MSKNRFPPGWDEARVQQVLEHYEKQPEDEALAEDEDGFGNRGTALIEVPKDLVPVIQELIAKYQSSRGC
jgi:hypothetical protein